MLYACLVGEPARDLKGVTLAQALERVQVWQPDLSGVPAAWRSVLETALDPDPAARFRSAREMAEALDRAVGADATPAPTARATRRLTGLARREDGEPSPPP